MKVVRFLLGPAGSGKTHRCLERLRVCERENRSGIYLVPEQFTYSADRELLAANDLAGLRHVRVLSFSRLAWWLHERAGATPPPAIDPAVRPMYLRAVLERLPPARLGPLAALRTRHGLLEQLGRFIGEVRNHGAADFLNGLRELEFAADVNPVVRSKLLALGEVFQDYDSWLRDRGRRDPEEHLHGVLPLIAAESELFGETEVFVDGFLSWTQRESEVLTGLALAGASLEVTFCMEEDAGEAERRLPFHPVARSLERLRGRFGRAGVTVDEVVHLPSEWPFRFEVPELVRLERCLYLLDAAGDARRSVPGSGNPRGWDALHSDDGSPGDVETDAAGSEGESKGVVAAKDVHSGVLPDAARPFATTEARGTASQSSVATDASTKSFAAIGLQSARDPYHEVQTWARAIDRWLRLEARPLRPEEIAIFVRNVERYREPVARIFPRFGIDYFLDERRSVLAHPRVRLLLGALEVVLSGWRRTSVISLLRNPYLGIAPSIVDLLENLSLELGRDFERWYEESDWEVYALVERSRFTGTAGEVVQDPVELLDPERAHGEEAPDDGEEEDGSESDELEASRTPRSASEGRLDDVRRRILLPLRQLERRWEQEGWTGDRAAQALVELLREWVPEVSGLHADVAERTLPCAVLRDRDWDARIDEALGTLLEELADLWRDVPAQPEEVARSLREGLLALRLGVTPMRQGQVLVADIQRSRVEGIRASIVGGVNEGVFPRTVSDDPILGDRDREALGSLGLVLGPNANERQEEEAYLFYIAMTRSSERLLVTWCGSETDGAEAAPSFLVAEISRLFPGLDLTLAPDDEEDSLPMEAIQNRAELGPALLSRLARMVGVGASAGGGIGGGTRGEARDDTRGDTRGDTTRDTGDKPGGEIRGEARGGAGGGSGVGANGECGRVEVRTGRGHGALILPDDIEPLWSRVHADDRLASVADDLDRGSLGTHDGLDLLLPESLLEIVFGDDIRSSVSRLQEFASCPFRNFAASLLRLEPRPEARITPLETGTLAHSALELFFSGATNEELRRLVRPDPVGAPNTLDRAAIQDRLEVIFSRLENEPAFRAFQVDEASRYRWASTRRSLERYLRLELARLAGAGYHVARRELPFGLGEEPGLGFELPGGRRLLVRGKIDRLDVRVDGDRTLGLVVDYKRSSRTGLPTSLERGTDLQLATYLLYVRDQLGMEPAGGLYVPVLPSPQREEKTDPGSANELKVRAHGIFLEAERDQIDAGTGILVERRSGQQLPDTARRDELLAAAATFLKSYAHNQRLGRIAPRPLQSEPSRLPCDRCDFPIVCRHRRDRDPKRRSALEGMEVVP